MSSRGPLSDDLSHRAAPSTDEDAPTVEQGVGNSRRVPGEVPSDEFSVAEPRPRAAASSRDAAHDSDVSAASFPTPFGHYVLLGELGRGGMGIVYHARQTSPSREVALKVILAGQFATALQRQRFRREAEMAGRLAHEGLVPVYEVGEIAGNIYYTMPLISGRSLAARLAAEPVLAPREAALIIRDAARAADYAHRRGVIHRDLKPGNLLLVEEPSRSGLGPTPTTGEPTPPAAGSIASAGGSGIASRRSDLVRTPAGRSQDDSEKSEKSCRVRITDFGLARTRGNPGDGGGEALTGTGQILGTPGYMPPEQASGDRRPLDATSDVFALGAILYRMITGRPPFVGDDAVDVLLKTAHGETPLPRSLRRDIPMELQWICMQCLEKHPEARYPSAAVLADDLDRFLLGEPVEARLGTFVHRTLRWHRRRPLFASHVWGIVAIMVAVLANYAALRSVMMPSFEYFLQIQTILAGWLVACLMIQGLIETFPRLQNSVSIAWLAFDVGMLTVLLSQVDESPTHLLIGYAALIVMSGLFFRADAIVVTTITALAGHIALCLLRSDVREPLHHTALLAVLLTIIGATMAYLVSRVRLLRNVMS